MEPSRFRQAAGRHARHDHRHASRGRRARDRHGGRASNALGLYPWLGAVTGVRRGELWGLQLADIDVDRGLIRVAFSYVVRGGKNVRKDGNTHQTRWIAIDPHTCTLIVGYLDEIRGSLAGVGVALPAGAYLFSNDLVRTPTVEPGLGYPPGCRVAPARSPLRWTTTSKGGRRYTASQLPPGWVTAAAALPTLKHYADPVPQVDRRAAEYLSRLTVDAVPADG